MISGREASGQGSVVSGQGCGCWLLAFGFELIVGVVSPVPRCEGVKFRDVEHPAN